ncbi:MAG: TetR/AcrR family transcriptional regulator [Oscillospiraceae bacterium]|nr:TetR/AcrR family transcriptional regulator [Oscillospiraceae bacterium]
MGKAEDKKRWKQSSLLDAALDLFTDKGLNQTSIAEIVDRAGVAKGTFYLYFKDKYDIRNRLIVYQSDKIFAGALAELETQTLELLEDKLMFIVNYVVNYMAQNTKILRLIAKDLGWGVYRSMLNEDGKNGGFRADFIALAERSNTHLKDPDIMLFEIVGLVGVSCYNIILYSEPVTLEAYKPYLYETVREIFRAHVIA